MIRVLLCLACVLVATTQTQTQSLCSDDVHCQEGSYCDTEAHLCTKCLACETHRRKPPETASACIRSITKCGPCIEEGDVSPECMGTTGGDATPAYVWGAAFVALLLLALIVFIIVYAVRNLDDLKIRACEYMNVCPVASASVQQPPQFSASAPQDCPPPYAPRPWDDYAPDSQPSSGTYVPQDDSIHPFISRDTKGRATGAYESDDNQAARPFGYPNYVHPPSYDHEPSPPRDFSATPTYSEDMRDSRDTRDSNGNAVHVTSLGEPAGGSATASAALALPAERRRHQFQDRNNNGSGSCAPPAPAPPALVINVMQTINALQQQNNVNARPVSP